MFKDNHMDKEELLLRSVLENGQEEVPEHIWNGVVRKLDKAAWRTRVMRISSAVAAMAAAALVVGVVLWDSAENVIVPEAEGGMIAVVENSSNAEDVLLADIPAEVAGKETIVTRNPVTYVAAPAPEENVVTPELEKERTVVVEEATTGIENQARTEDVNNSTGQDDKEVTTSEVSSWVDDERELKDKRIRASIVLSGVAGTNSPQAKSGVGPLRSPVILKAPSKTTIRQIDKQAVYGIPVSVGVGARLHFNKRWALGIGLNYSLLTSKFNGEYTKVENGTPSLPISEYIRNTQHYVGIPVNAYYNIISRDFINFYAYAGGTVEKCVYNHYQLLNTQTITHKESVEGVQLSANAGIGVEFMLGRHVGLYLDPSLRYYFNCSQPTSIRTAQPLMLGFELGFRFNL